MFCYHDSIQIKRSVHVSVPINQECQVYENVPKAQTRPNGVNILCLPQNFALLTQNRVYSAKKRPSICMIARFYPKSTKNTPIPIFKCIFFFMDITAWI